MTAPRDVTGETDGAVSRRHFHQAAAGFVAVVDRVSPDSWQLPALGVWSVRDLTGHASRALLTVENYLDPTSTVTRPTLPDPLAYFRAVTSTVAHPTLSDPAAVAERGRQAGADLGDEPSAAVAAIAERVLALVDRSDDQAVIQTPTGSTMRLVDYLPTRTFELVVHSLDLAAAVGADAPDELSEPARACLRLAADLAWTQGHAADLLLALTGRRSLPVGFSVL